MLEGIALLVSGVTFGVLAGAATMWWRRLRQARVADLEAAAARPTAEDCDRAEIDAIESALRQGDEIFLPTGKENEFLVYSATPSTVTGVAIPSDLARTVAQGASSVLSAGVDAAKASGRLVMVDGATAKAIREGALATDKAGRSLAMVRGAGGKWEHIARLTPAASKAAGAALGVANVLGAVSTQMQMAAIEAKLSDIVEGVHSLERVAKRELDSSIYATRQLVGEVVGASRHAGHLPAESWSQLAPHYKTIIEDQQMARGAVNDLIDRARDDPKGFWLKSRASSIQTNREELIERMNALKEADLNIIRMHMVRLWHYTVVQPELAAYFEQLAREEMTRQAEVETTLIDAAQVTISQHGELDRLDRIFHWSKGDDYRRQVEEFSNLGQLQRPAGSTQQIGSASDPNAG